AVLGGLDVRLLAALELLALVAQAPALALERRELALRFFDRALGFRELRVALALDVDELRVLLGFAALDLGGFLLQMADSLLGHRDRLVLGGEHAALDASATRGTAEPAEHAVERLGVLLDLDP